MLKGIYASSTGMRAQSQKLDVTAANLANAQTAGYKRDSLPVASFGAVLYDTYLGQASGGSAAGTHGAAVVTDYTPGALTQTGSETDLAITSQNGWFAVQGGAGVRYTRAGSFQIDAQGYLALADGSRLLGENGAIQVGTGGFGVASDGTVTRADGTQAGRIALFDGTPSKTAEGLFTLAGAQPAQGTVMQGALESSNVSLVDEMAAMMAATRAYQRCQQAFRASDTTAQKLMNEVASLK